MELELPSLPVTGLAAGDVTRYRPGGLLEVSVPELRAMVLQDYRLTDVAIEIVHPGESTRIVHALDVVEPRAKLAGPGEVFPGILVPPRTVGSGRTLRLQGMAVVTTGTPPDLAFDTVANFSEAIIDMSGPGAELTPFSRLENLVLCCVAAPGVSGLEFSRATRLAALQVSRHLAQRSGAQAGSGTIYRLAAAAPDLPRVVVISELARTGDLYDTFLYGRSVEGMVPTLLHPNEFLDGAVVSGNYRYACQRNPTYYWQNHPVIEALYPLHGQELVLAGVVVARGHASNLLEKEMAAEYCAKLARELRADAAIVTGEGGGHAMMELMLICRSCEQAGVKTALIMAEMAGPEGADNPFVDFVREANLIVSVGNQEERLDLPAMERVVGGDALLETGEDPRGRLLIPTRHLYCATCQVGSSQVMSKAF